MCNKQQYDKKTVKTILNERKSKGKKWSREVRYYECEQCGKWHLSSKEEWEPPYNLGINDLVFRDKWLELVK